MSYKRANKTQTDPHTRTSWLNQTLGEQTGLGKGFTIRTVQDGSGTSDLLSTLKTEMETLR